LTTREKDTIIKSIPIVFRKEMSCSIKASFLENTEKYSWILISLSVKDKKNREVLSKLDEVNKCCCENEKLPIKGFRSRKHSKFNKLDFDINQNFEAFIILF